MSELQPEQELKLLAAINLAVDQSSALDLKVFTDKELRTIVAYHICNTKRGELTAEEAKLMKSVYRKIQEQQMLWV